VLLAYSLALRRRHAAGALAAAAAIGCRQTNAVWVGFIACSSLARLLEETPAGKPPPAANPAAAAAHYLQAAAARPGAVGRAMAGYGALLAGFVTFVVRNGGIVVGDKAAHAPVVRRRPYPALPLHPGDRRRAAARGQMHLPQLLYFSGFAAAFIGLRPLFRGGCGGLATLRGGGWARCAAQAAAAAAVLAAVMLVVRHQTLEHKYLLADNRHFTFYVWKNTFRRFPLFRCAPPLPPSSSHCEPAPPVALLSTAVAFSVARTLCGP
jgi:alpha-1,2-glucosyltransferase